MSVAGRSVSPVRIGGVVLPILLLVIGCGLFEPREPEEPVGSEVPYNIPETTEILLQNLKETTEMLDTANFREDLAQEGTDGEDFEFWFDINDTGEGGTEFYTYGDVIGALETLFKISAEVVTLEWGEADVTGAGGDEEIHWNRPYTLVFRQSASDSTGIKISGKATLYFQQRSGGRYVLYKWEDLVDLFPDTKGTWGWALLNPSLPS